MPLRVIPLWLLVTLQVVISAASLVVEIVAGRMLAPYVGMSLYTWTAIIAVVLAGFSAGHWWGGRLAGHSTAEAMRKMGWILLGAALLTALALPLLQLIAAPVLGAVSHPLWAITLLCSGVFFLPSLFAGVPAPILAQIGTRDTEDTGRALGALFAAGAIGAIAGTLLAGFVFISLLGTALTLALVTLCYVLAAGLSFWLGGSIPRLSGIVGLAALLCAGYAVSAPNPCTVESRHFCIRSLEMPAPEGDAVQMMVLDHLVHGMSAKGAPELMFTDHAAMLDALAQLRAPEPGFSSFFIGGGTYSIPRAIAHRGGGPVTVAEIDPEVTRIAARDFWFDPDSARIVHRDARAVLAAEPDLRYDVIIGDAFTDIAVPQHLVTREFFELVQNRLTPGGSYLMNVIDFEDQLYALAAVLRSLQDVFPVVEIWTEAAQPEPGQRMVFVLVAGDARTETSHIDTRSPESIRFAALSDDMLERIAARGSLILTDDFAPIDRLMGFRK